MTDLGAVLSFRSNLRACERCELSAGCSGPVPWYGDLNPDIAVVGEAPGETEDKLGQPFVGSAGQLIRTLMRQAGIVPEDCTWLNVVSCWPHGTPTKAHRDACHVWLSGQLQILQPQLIITLGVVAFEQVRQENFPKLAAIHGMPMYWDSPFNRRSTYVMSTYHPSAVLRGSPKYKKIILDDLQAIQDATWADFRDQCYVHNCNEELYRSDGWGIGLCKRHSMRQGNLFPEETVG